MIRILINRGSIARLSWTQLSCFYSRNFSQNTENVSNYSKHSSTNTAGNVEEAGASMKNTLKLCENLKTPRIGESERGKDWNGADSQVYPSQCDVLIIGGGAIGSAAAYWCKVAGGKSLRVVVVEKDQTYKEASTVLSCGGIRQQFSLEESIELSLFGAEFIGNANQYLGIDGESPVDLQFKPHGYLSLASEDTAETLKKNSELQNSLGAKNTLLNKRQLKEKFPWLTTDDIEAGCLGIENEGWFDPWLLLAALRRKAMSLGVEFITATAKGFNFKQLSDDVDFGTSPTGNQSIDSAFIETNNGKCRSITFNKCVIAAGAFSGDVAKMAKIGYGKDKLSVKLPVEPRKRYVYCFHAPDGPRVQTPHIIDTTGVYFRSESVNNNYICGRCPEEGGEPPIDNLEVDQTFFDEHIWPHLAHRVKAFENLKVTSSWAGYYEYNTFDQNGVVGIHPHHNNIIFATGFSGHGIQHSPAVGRAVSELIHFSSFKTIDLNRFSFDRLITSKPLRELNIW